MAELLDEMPKLDILADVRGSPSVALAAIGEELKRLPLVFRLIRQPGAVARQAARLPARQTRPTSN